MIADYIVLGMPEINRDELIAGMNDSTYDQLARLQWKYGCSKGVTGAPVHFGNDFKFDSTGWGGEEWTALVHKYGSITKTNVVENNPISLGLEDSVFL